MPLEGIEPPRFLQHMFLKHAWLPSYTTKAKSRLAFKAASHSFVLYIGFAPICLSTLTFEISAYAISPVKLDTGFLSFDTLPVELSVARLWT